MNWRRSGNSSLSYKRIEIGGVVRVSANSSAGLCSTVAIEVKVSGSACSSRSRSRRCCRTRRGSSAVASAAARCRGCLTAPQMTAVARTQHDAVFAERHRVRVAINGPAGEFVKERHRRNNHRDFGGWAYLIQKHCSFTDRNAASIGNTQGYLALNTVGDTTSLFGNPKMFPRSANTMIWDARRSCSPATITAA